MNARITRPLPPNGEADCPQCGSVKSVARHNSRWTCYKCGFVEVVDDEREAERSNAQMKKPNFKPLTDRVLVHVTPAQTVSKGGIHIPEMARPVATRQGRVAATGPKVLHISDGVKVLLPEFGGQAVTLEGDNYLLFAESEIMAVVGH